MSNWEKAGWAILFSQLGIAVLPCLVAVAGVEVDTELAAGLLIGSLFVQILLSAVWTSLAPVNLFVRVFIGALVTFFFSTCMYWIAFRDGGGGVDLANAIVIPMLAQWVMFQIPLWVIRFQGRRLVARSSQLESDRQSEFQFGIKHLLTWTTVIAIFVGVTRALIASAPEGDGSSRSTEWEIALFLTLGNSAIAFPIIWGGITRYLKWLWMTIGVGMCVAVSAFQFWMLQGSGKDIEFVFVINIAQTVLAILAMLAVRMTGYRLQKIAINS